MQIRKLERDEHIQTRPIYETIFPSDSKSFVDYYYAEKTKVLAEIDRIEKKLSNQQFVDKAPEKVVAAEREKLKGYQATLAGIEDSIRSLSKK